MPASRITSAILVWSAALLSPIQAMQGTRVLCQLFDTESKVATCEDACCECKSQASVGCEASLCQTPITARTGPAGQQPPCPSGCFYCQDRCTQFAPTMSPTTPSATGLSEAIVDQVDVISRITSHGFVGSRQTSSLSEGSALQICALLCRFTT